MYCRHKRINPDVFVSKKGSKFKKGYIAHFYEPERREESIQIPDSSLCFCAKIRKDVGLLNVLPLFIYPAMGFHKK